MPGTGNWRNYPIKSSTRELRTIKWEMNMYFIGLNFSLSSGKFNATAPVVISLQIFAVNVDRLGW